MRDSDWIASQVMQAELRRRYRRRQAIRSGIARVLRFGGGGGSPWTGLSFVDERSDAPAIELARGGAGKRLRADS